MRRFLRAVALALLLAALPVAAQAQVAFVQSAFDITDPFITDGIADVTLGANCTVGNLLIAGFYVEAGSRTVTSVTGCGATLVLCSQGGVDATIQTVDPFEGWLYCGVATSTGTAFQITLSSAVGAGNQKAFVAEFSGQHATFASAIEDIAVATNTALGDHDTGTVTTASAGSALVGFIFGTPGVYTNDADFTALASFHDGTGSAGYDLVDAVTASYNVTSAGTETTGQMIIAIAPAAAGGSPNASKRMLRGLGAELRRPFDRPGPTTARAAREFWASVPVEMDTRIPVEAPRRPRYRGRP